MRNFKTNNRGPHENGLSIHHPRDAVLSASQSISPPGLPLHRLINPHDHPSTNPSHAIPITLPPQPAHNHALPPRPQHLPPPILPPPHRLPHLAHNNQILPPPQTQIKPQTQTPTNHQHLRHHYHTPTRAPRTLSHTHAQDVPPRNGHLPKIPNGQSARSWQVDEWAGQIGEGRGD